jgi:hypothetical protein
VNLDIGGARYDKEEKAAQAVRQHRRKWNQWPFNVNAA